MYYVSMKAKVLIIWLCFVLLGTFVGPIIVVNPRTYLLIGLLICASSLVVLRKVYFFGILFGIGLLFISIFNFQYKASTLETLNHLAAKESVKVTAYVDDLPQKTQFGTKVIFRINTSTEPALVGTKFFGYVRDYPKLTYPEIVKADIKISEYAPDKKWSLIKNDVIGESSIYTFEQIGFQIGPIITLKGWLLSLRLAFNDAIARSLPAAEAGLASGIILGEKALLTQEMIRDLQTSGTTHIIALSGYNITVILGLFIFMKSRFSKLTNLVVPVIFIILFTLMTGAAPSLVRAAIMGALPLAARYLGRESDNFISILFAATVMAMFNPFLPLYDVGFQLSFVAFAGIIYISPIIANMGKSLGETASGAISESLGAQIATIPLLSYYFGMLSIVSPVANFVILGLMPTCMALAFLVGFGGMIWAPLGNFFAIPTYFLLHFVNQSISFFGNLPGAAKSIKIENPLWILVFYFVLFDAWYLLRNVGRVRPT